MIAAPLREARRDPVSPAESYCLLRSLDELGHVLLETLAEGFSLDAFLVAAGMRQIVQDELHPDPLRLDEVASFLGSSVVRRCGRALQAVRRPDRQVRAFDRDLERIVDELAALGPVTPALRMRAAALVERLDRLPARVRESVLRLPACFHDFDQRPEDVAELARRFAARHPDRGRRLLVAGVRTSGSYLGPLYASALRDLGFEHAEWITVRPGRRLLRDERRAVRDAGLVVVVDDPPGTGGSLARVVRELGVERSAVLLLQLFEGQDVPEKLAGFETICLPWEEWAIHGLLAPDGADRLPAARGHAQARYPSGGTLVLATGVGLGYFGSAAARVAGALQEFLPAVLDTGDGVLRREWLSDGERAADPETIVAYIRARAAALPVREDFSLRLRGEFPAWEVAGNVLTRSFGRAGPVAKVLGVDAAARRLLRVEEHSLVDGWMDARQWFVPGVKVGFSERSFWHLGLACFDPLHDLAGAAAGQDEAFVDALVREYGDVDPERFLMYALAHLWTRERLYPEDRPAVRRALGAAVRRYIRARFLAGLEVSADGPVCALDLDGVLETEHLGFPSTSRSGALALRGLIQAGCRPVIASGRSAQDVADRCAGYGLSGGVAEYGGALVADGEIRSLLTDEQEAALARVRDALAGHRLDPHYRHSVRAYGLGAADVERALAAGGVRAVRGDGQIDFVPDGIDKASGLRALLDGEELAFAVGDTISDLPMLELAARGAAPGHAPRALRRFRVRPPYQAGLAQAVERYLGGALEHRLDDRAELLLTILSAQERGSLGMLRAALRLRRAA